MNSFLNKFWKKHRAVIIKWLKGACVALLGAFLTYLQDTIPNIDFGTATVFVGAINSILINGIRLLIAKYLL